MFVCNYLVYKYKGAKNIPLLQLLKQLSYIELTFTYMDFLAQVQRYIYTTNWIERVNRKYKRTINMRTSMSSEKSAIFLLAAVTMEQIKMAYNRRIYQFKNWKEKNKKEWKNRERKDELHTFKDTTSVVARFVFISNRIVSWLP